MLALWAMLMTGIAISYGVQGHWRDFCEALVTAFGSLAMSISFGPTFFSDLAPPGSGWVVGVLL